MEKFYSIGEISKLFKTTTRQIRFYNELGLLIPKKVDSQTKYRYYSEEDCEKLKNILCLKDIGLSLSDISLFFSSTNEQKEKILLKYYNQNKQSQELLDYILNNKDFSLSSTNYIKYIGGNIRSKNLDDLCGVWTLHGIFRNIKDVKVNTNQIKGITPYKFLAFDEMGNSPWFYSADDKFIIFNTFKTPIKEIYQIKDSYLYVKIKNPQEHIFGEITNEISTEHILVFEKASDNYNDYVKYLTHDTISEDKFQSDPNLIGVWKLKNDNNLKYIIVEKNKTAKICSNSGIKEYKWNKGYLYDENMKIKLNYSIKSDRLILENKTRSYIFSNIKNKNEYYNKINNN